MASTLLLTPGNWFDLARVINSIDTPASLELVLTDGEGRRPLAGVRLDELRAVYHTFGKWSSDDRFLSGCRQLLKETAQAALASLDAAPTQASRRLRFPDLDHALLAEPSKPLGFLEHFLYLSHSPSLVDWARTLLAAEDAAQSCRSKPWLRLLLQKVATEDGVSEALACLRSVYAGSPADRQELLAAEAGALAELDLTNLQSWSRSLGLDRPVRTRSAFDPPARRPSTNLDPDVTVLVPSYCHGDYIEATLESVLAQTYPRHRVLVVDDRSSDSTVERASRVDDPRVQIQVNDANLGLGDSVLSALATIGTPYVAVLNSDDLFHPQRLERCRSILSSSPDVQVVATGFIPIDAEGRTITADNVSRIFDGPKIADWIQWLSHAGQTEEHADLLAGLLERNFLISSSNIVCRTDFLRRRADSLRGLKYCFDWQIFLEAAVDRSLVYLREELLGYRLHGSNTVWFDEDRKVAYTLEVNRVLAHTLRRAVEESAARAGGGDVSGVLDLLTRHAAKHSEANALTLYAVGLLGGRNLEEARDRSRAVHESLRELSDLSANATGQDSTATAAGSEALASAAWALSDAAHDQATAAWAAERTARQELQGVQAERQQIEADWRRTEAERQQVEAGLRQAMAQRQQVEADLRRVEAERQQVEADLRRQTAEMESSVAARSRAHAEELARLRSSPEWQVGNAVWNRAGLSKLGGGATRAASGFLDRRNRWGLALGRSARRARLARPRAVVAACWHFPIHSQTFVYQEMQGLAWAGLDYRVFCCDTNPKSELPAAFETLWDKRVVLQTGWRFNQRDLDHFLRTRPERVDGLLQRLGDSTGLTRDELLRESIVMMGFTFARHVELAGAEYLHTYFFYDQSLLALMAAYLLHIPRGITAYADHMIGDYAFKCVPLHLELADIVVATSRRIKSELSAIGGGRFDAKIIVKPNGVDTNRFPYVDPADRLNATAEPELIAVNRIEPKKGLLYLVEALGILKARDVMTRLHIVGGADTNTPASADYYRRLTSTIDELRLADRVVLHGTMQQPEFAPLLARSRIFIAPYVEVASGDKDGIPTAVLEAMSAGLPIVATDAGSIAEAVTDGVEALAVAQRDPVGLADAIQRLLDDRVMYVRMAEAARRRAVSEFDAHVTETRLHERIKACLTQQDVDQ